MVEITEIEDEVEVVVEEADVAAEPLKEPESLEKPEELEFLEEKSTEAVGEEAKGHDFNERYSLEEEIKVIHYMHQFTHAPETEDMVEKFRGSPPNTVKFWQGFIDATNSKRAAHSLYVRWPRLLQKLHKMPIGTEIKLNLFYSLSVPIPEEFMETVRKEANFAMDEERNLEAFEMKSPEEIQTESVTKKPRKRRSPGVASSSENPPAPKRPKIAFDEAEDVEMWTFLLGKITDPETKRVKKDQLKPKSVALWREYKGMDADIKSVRRCVAHYMTMTKHLYKMPFNTRMKVDLYYGLSIPVNPGFLDSLQQQYEFETDENGCIIEYNSEEIHDN